MKLDNFSTEFHPVPGAATAWRADVDAAELPQLCAQVRDSGGRLVALWGSDEGDAGYAVHVALGGHDGLLCLCAALDGKDPSYPDVSAVFPAADRMQRAAYDLLGIRATGAEDTRKWLRHGAWPDTQFPLRKEFDANAVYPTEDDAYPFVRVEGEGAHEIPVGPVHAGTIEPGHFRFSVVGERILRLGERLGYKHKGIEKRFEALGLEQGARLAARVSGDSTVAYGWAWAMAVEGVAGCTPPPRALWLRALLLERERVMNHLGDLGALGNDAGLAFGLAQFMRLKEDMLRINQSLFGHRYLMDAIIPGGVARDIDYGAVTQLHEQARTLEQEIAPLKAIYDEHAGVQDRFLSAGRVTPELAAQLGLTGFAGRASGQAWDLRAQFPSTPYDQLEVRMATHRNGDVAARATVRFEEIGESLRLMREILVKLPEGDIRTDLPPVAHAGFGIGLVEGWRGDVLVALHTASDGSVHRVHPHDPSWQNWPLLEHAVIGNIVPDFPLINKSFNLSYSGQDL